MTASWCACSNIDLVFLPYAAKWGLKDVSYWLSMFYFSHHYRTLPYPYPAVARMLWGRLLPEPQIKRIIGFHQLFENWSSMFLL
jgi:hypothetical protein